MMDEETETIEEEKKEEKEDSDTQLMSPIGYIQERLQKLEDAQKEIQETLIEYKKRIDICSIQR